MEREDDRPVLRKQLVERAVDEAVRVLGVRQQLHEVDDVDDVDDQVRQVLAQDRHRCERLERGHVTAARHHDVGLDALIVACPLPHADTLRAVRERVVHRQPLRRRMLAGDDDVHVVPAAQAVVHHRHKAVRIGRQVYADDLGLLVHDVFEEAGILVREAVVVLAPHV